MTRPAAALTHQRSEITDVTFVNFGPRQHSWQRPVRHTLDDIEGKGGWQRLELCAQAFCGSPGPG